MKTLAIWELGGGLGHLARLVPVLRELVKRGHDVVLACAQPVDSAAARALTRGITTIRLPVLVPPNRMIDTSRPIGQYAAILDLMGWGDARYLARAAEQRRSFIAAQKPGLLVMDASPLSLLASEGLSMKRVLLSDGWGHPPDVCPLPDLALAYGLTETAGDGRVEPGVLAAVNGWHAGAGLEALPRLGALFERADRVLMFDHEAFDPYGDRPGMTYHGTWLPRGGAAAQWPGSDEGPRVFGYLKRFSGLEALLTMLSASTLPTLVYLAGADAAEAAGRSTATMRVVSEPVDLRRVAGQCELGICHAGRGTVGALLGGGVPLLLVPLTLEQRVVAQRCRRSTGAVAVAEPGSAGALSLGLQGLLVEPGYGEAAARFAAGAAEVEVAGVVDGLLSD